MRERLSPAEIDVEAKALCPHCRGGNQPTRRVLTGEFIHTWRNGNNFKQVLCAANTMRLTGIKTNA